MEKELTSLSELEVGQVLVKVLPNTPRKEILKALKSADDLYIVQSVDEEAIVLKVAMFASRNSNIEYEVISISPSQFFYNCCWYIR